MNFTPELPNLSILKLEQIISHEHVDERRVERLRMDITKEEVLKNPPVVLSPSAGLQNYVVLDGASRLAAFRDLKVEHILVQIVDPARESIQVEAWNHVVLGSPVEDVIAKLEQDPMIQFTSVEEHDGQSVWAAGNPAVYLVTQDQRTYRVISKKPGLEAQMDFLNRFVDAYHRVGDVERTVTGQTAQLPSLHENFEYLVFLPKFELSDVLDITRQKLLIPAGLTRFVIVPRALRVNYPLSKLIKDQPIEEKRDELGKWLQDKTSQRGIRFYAESAFL